MSGAMHEIRVAHRRGVCRRANGRGERRLAHCPVSGKIRFRDKTEAVTALHAATTTKRHFAEIDGTCTNRRERRSYRCTSCRGWHLTSQANRWQTAA